MVGGLTGRLLKPVNKRTSEQVSSVISGIIGWVAVQAWVIARQQTSIKLFRSRQETATANGRGQPVRLLQAAPFSGQVLMASPQDGQNQLILNSNHATTNS